MTDEDGVVATNICELSVLPELPRRKPNQLLQLLELFPDKPWGWKQLSRNPNITMEFIATNLSCAWDWKNLCSNPNLTKTIFLEWILPKLEQLARDRNTSEQKEFEWSGGYHHCWNELSKNPGLKIADILQLRLADPKRYRWNWSLVSGRSDVTLEMLSTNTTTGASDEKTTTSASASIIAWNYKGASNNPNLTTEFILHPTNLSKFWDLWDWTAIARNPSIKPTAELINHPKYKYHSCCEQLPTHPLLSFPLMLEHLKVHPHLDSGYPPGINEFTNENCWNDLSTNNAITMEIIRAHPHLPWNWNRVYNNPNLTAADVVSDLFRNREIDKEYLSANPNILPSFILSNKEKYCSLLFISDNPNLTAQLIMEIANANIKCGGEEWDWEGLSNNEFAFCPRSLAAKEFQHHQLMDPVVWAALLSANIDIDSVKNNNIGNNNNLCDIKRSRVRRLPTALAKLSLEYFSPYF